MLTGELYKFTSNIRAVAPCAEGDLVVRKLIIQSEERNI